VKMNGSTLAEGRREGNSQKRGREQTHRFDGDDRRAIFILAYVRPPFGRALTLIPRAT
jgi:hypothetical protein